MNYSPTGTDKKRETHPVLIEITEIVNENLKASTLMKRLSSKVINPTPDEAKAIDMLMGTTEVNSTDILAMRRLQNTSGANLH